MFDIKLSGEIAEFIKKILYNINGNIYFIIIILLIVFCGYAIFTNIRKNEYDRVIMLVIFSIILLGGAVGFFIEHSIVH
ncbi:hypothetical protein [Dethiothermospora halolimnae]|uniref:hypothetical protein n=1 Tax=Dethiothermospora halolimnae TaxID=3114390 RepID=UPI003CCBA95A